MTDASESLPSTGRLAGIDFGTVRIGVAISDASQSIASPLENYQRRNEKLDLQYFAKLVEEESVVGFVVGLPVHMSGDESGMSQMARQFGKQLNETTGRPVSFYDERLTSALANEMLEGAGLTKKQRKQRMDKLAAQILLASFLESSRQSRQDLPFD